MEKQAYPAVPLYRYPYTALTEASIGAALARAAQAGPERARPAPASHLPASFRIITDGGPAIAYSMAGTDRLSLAVDGAEAQAVRHGLLHLANLDLLVYLLPGTLRGHALLIDRESRLATLMEFWFAGQKAGRELSRMIWHGYLDDGSPAPEVRHAATNRLEGKGFYWKDDAGNETLDYYSSAAYSHWVELTRLDGRFGYSAPSDYIHLNEWQYLYTRTEAEFSGIFTLYAMDLNRQRQIGLRIGFNGLDELEYRLFTGQGEWLGQLARFEQFGDTSPAPIPPPDETPGSRRIYRPLETMARMTPDQVNAVVARSRRIFAGRSVMAGNGIDPSGKLAGRKLTLRYDGGPVMEYDFIEPELLRFRKDGQDWREARYNAFESAPGLFIMGHMVEGEPNHDAHSVVLDLDSGKATCFHGYLNTPYFANEAGARELFGKVEGEGIPDPGSDRHDYTEDMLGRALTWNYGPGLTSMHLYSTPYTTSWIIFTPSGHGGMQWSGSGAQVKIRDGLYFIYWLEEACNGTLGTILVNLRTMRNTGIDLHCGERGLSLGQVGAHARHAGKLDVARFFPKRSGGENT